jgi:hypothetical protein
MHKIRVRVCLTVSTLNWLLFLKTSVFFSWFLLVGLSCCKIIMCILQIIHLNLSEFLSNYHVEVFSCVYT